MNQMMMKMMMKIHQKMIGIRLFDLGKLLTVNCDKVLLENDFDELILIPIFDLQK